MQKHDANAVVVTLLLFLFCLQGYLHWRFRRRVAAIFERSLSDKPTLADITGLVETINAESPGLFFTAERTANVSFRSQSVLLVEGQICYPGVRGNLDSSRSVYAIASPEQKAWMLSNPDAFTLSFSGTTVSIFWVNIAKFLDQSERPRS